MICERGDVVVVSFRFGTTEGVKRRPALVVSKKDFNEFGHTILSMITTRSHHPWPGDVLVRNHEQAGLKSPCIVRLKLFTLDNDCIIEQIGQLTGADREKLAASSRLYISADYLDDVDFALPSEH